ncbi:MAG: transposase [Verrucomicrobiota bacterium]
MPEAPGWHSRGFLPHYDDGAYLQAITYRLADALPAEVVAKLEEQSLDDELRREQFEHYLDAGHGYCVLRKPECAKAVVENWRHFHGARYRLHAWVVMPNHVHILIGHQAGCTLSEIVQSWKSYTAKVILRHCANGQFPGNHVWQADYWDRFIRNERHYASTVDYIHNNPVKAGLVTRPQDWPWSSAGSAGGPPAS